MTRRDICCECNDHRFVGDDELFCTHCYRAICNDCLPPGARELHTKRQDKYDCYGSDFDSDSDDDYDENDDDDDDDVIEEKIKKREDEKKKKKEEKEEEKRKKKERIEKLWREGDEYSGDSDCSWSDDESQCLRGFTLHCSQCKVERKLQFYMSLADRYRQQLKNVTPV
jgi:hypothetical protein